MARITCAISGIRFECSYLESINLNHTAGYFHPIFAVNYTSLHHLYSKHCRGQLTSNDSYLLFMAFLHSSGKIEWRYPCSLNPNNIQTKKIVENNLAQLIAVLEKSAVIHHPSFKQPSFKVTHENCSLAQIPSWIRAWQDNIKEFQLGRVSIQEQQDLIKVENKLSYLILSGEKPEKFSAVISNWASQAAAFPEDKDKLYQRTIRSCFNATKMFKTPLSLLKEIKDFCECNIEAGSIHFHTLHNVLKEGISNHIDYLGGVSLKSNYTLLPPLVGGIRRERELKNIAELDVIAAAASKDYPREDEYPNKLEFIKAKLAYRVKANSKNIDNDIDIKENTSND